MPTPVSHSILFISIFIVVLIGIYAGQISNATYALDFSEKIDTLRIDNNSDSPEGTLHRRSYFYIGSEYVSAQNSVVSYGQMYVEHLVPIKVIQQPFPIVFIPGNGMVAITCLSHWCSTVIIVIVI